MFPIRWRWNANALARLPRQRGGKRVPPPLQRMESENLLAAVFPDQLACLENIAGDREVPDHPLVKTNNRRLPDGSHGYRRTRSVTAKIRIR